MSEIMSDDALDALSDPLATWDDKREQQLLTGRTPEQLAVARALALAKMRTPGPDHAVIVPTTTPEPFQLPEPDYAAAFTRYIGSILEGKRASVLGPEPRWFRVVARWRWNRKRRELERADEVAINALCRAAA